MKKLISLCAGRPVTVIMVLSALITGAIFSLSVLKLDQLPEMQVPRVTVETVYPGMSAPDVRSIITIPVEDALSPVKGLERMRSISRDGSSLVTLDFRWGTDVMSASVLVREAIDAVYPSLPDGVRKPAVVPGDPGALPHAIIAVRSLNGDSGFARSLAEYELRARLRRIDGAGTIILAGGDTEEERVRLDIPRMVSRGLSAGQFVQILSAETADIPAGNAREGDQELVIVSSGRPGSVGELSRLILPAGAGPLQLTDAGEIRREHARRKSLFVCNGSEETALEIYRRPGADPVRLSRDIQKVLDEAASLFSRDAEIHLVRDSSKNIIRGVSGLGVSAALGAAAVIGTLFFFIRRIRYSLLAAVSIPISAAAGICVLALTGRSLNGMSLGGLALGIGLVSDTGVIVLDLLHRSFGNCRERPSPAEIGCCAASVALSSAASTITTAVVFVPVIFLPGPLGSIFGDTAAALVSSITAGWLYAQFCIPPLYRIFFKPFEPGKNAVRRGLSADKSLEKKYRRFLRPALRHPLRLLVAASLASLLGAALLLSRPAAFVSPENAEEVQVSLAFLPGMILESAGKTGSAISSLLAGLPCVDTVYGKAGSEDEDVGRRADTDYRKEELILHCVLNKNAGPEKALEEIRSGLAAAFDGAVDLLPEGTIVSVSFPQDRTERLLGLASACTLAVRGKDPPETAERAALVTGEMKKRLGPDLLSLNMRPSGTRPELRLLPNREAAAYLGISTAQIAETLYTVTEGQIAAQLEIEGRPLNVRVSGKMDMGIIDPSDLAPQFLLGKIPLAAEGGKVFLSSLGRIERRESQAALARLDRGDVIYLDALPLPGRGKNLSAAIQDSFSAEKNSETSRVSRADESAFTRYRTSLLVTVCLVLILLYMTMGAQFESFSLPLVFMLSIPFSLAGTGPALFLAGANLDSGSVLGLTALFGLAVNNGIILFEISEEKIRSGFPPVRAVYEGACERIQAVLITTATTVIALLPLALSPLGASQRSMSVAMLGGVIASTLLTLFAMPPVFIRFFQWRGGHE
ncbi:MAG: efflux RND transporter permease subunit [Treponema sp.]|jgi:multidrug efflux pump subunit AcrB|nr:efflux RND transporter permease subunit [Treponema sp.]